MRAAIALAATAFLAGCASFSPDGGFGPVDNAVRERTGQQAKWVRSQDDANSVRARVQELLAQPLTADSAAQIALLNNPGLQASYAELGIAEADLVQASRWSGPKLSFARLRHGGSAEGDYERGIFFDILGLITIPLATKAQEKHFEAAKARAAGQALGLALETRKTFFATVAAEEGERYMERVKESSEASAELARRMAAVGNWPKLKQQREQVFYAETTAQLARVKQARAASRERLARLLGLTGEELAFKLPERLPELPKTVRDGAGLEAQALAQRLDVQGARQDAEALAESLGLSKVSRFVNLLEIGRIQEKEGDESRHSGWGIELRIPIFDFGEARVARGAISRATTFACRKRCNCTFAGCIATTR